MAMTADEVYVALKELHKQTEYGVDKLEERLNKRVSDLENRLQRRIDGIWNKLDELDGPDR